METFEKLEYKINAGILAAKKEKEYRLDDRIKLPLKGLDGEDLYITGISRLNDKAEELYAMYDTVPESYRVTSVILIDAHSSATIEGAHTTVERMEKCLRSPETKDEIMVANTFKACSYAYESRIDSQNIRALWDIIVEGVCDNTSKAGSLYRNGMVYVGNENKTIHTPAKPEAIPKLMDDLFLFENQSELNPIIKSFVFHFYFVYIHPFCDGNGRTARTLNSSQLYFSGFSKIKSVAMSTSINRDLNAYYKCIRECEKTIGRRKADKWLDISPFVDYMLGILEDSFANAVLANSRLNENEKKLLDRMNKAGKNTEITINKAKDILGITYDGARKLLIRLSNEGYLTIINDKKPYIYKLQHHV